jgi:NAD(P)-dependent dehydrogenase (short-subunit alcohol dehydrogenase family)
MSLDTDFNGKTALVIGGSGGIGREISIALAKRGAFVTVHGGSSETRLTNTVNDILSSGGNAKGFLLHLGADANNTHASGAHANSAPTSPETAVKEILSLTEIPDILVCSWGPFERKPLADTTSGDWQYAVNWNLIFPGAFVSAILPEIIKKKWGRILLFGGTNTDTIKGYLTTAAYSSAKTAIAVLAKSAAREASGSGVTCNVICPGLVDTEYQTKAARDYNRIKSPCGKPLTVKEIAHTAIQVLENPNLNGAVITVDRGVFLN